MDFSHLSRRTFLQGTGTTAAGVAITGTLGAGGIAVAEDASWAFEAKALDETTIHGLIAMARQLYPHEFLDDGPYVKVVAGLDASARRGRGSSDVAHGWRTRIGRRGIWRLLSRRGLPPAEPGAAAPGDKARRGGQQRVLRGGARRNPGRPIRQSRSCSRVGLRGIRGRTRWLPGPRFRRHRLAAAVFLTAEGE